MGRLFGTDGIRGVANGFLSAPLAFQVGRAAAGVLEGKAPIAIGMDPRRSSDMLAMSAASGVCSACRDAVMLGVVTTPAVAYLTERYGCGGGIMISASHNPPEYNGIKIFTGDGLKLPDDMESRIEEIVAEGGSSGGIPGRVRHMHAAAVRDYAGHLCGCAGGRLDGLRIAVDCANGAAAVTARALFTALGAEVHVLGCDMSGGQINVGCGAMHMEYLAEYVAENMLDAGVAFDGDGDRCLFVDETGAIVDGDGIMAICALDMKRREGLPGVVGTVMSNLGFVKFCEANGLEFEAAQVGDRYVLEHMLEKGCRLGGEQSGHIIFLEHAATGDGQLTALKLLTIMARKRMPLSRLAAVMRRYPQKLVNVPVSDAGRATLGSDAAVCGAVDAARARLGAEGRILVRASGTEPVIRIMAEAADQALVEAVVDDVARVVSVRLG